MAQRWQPAVSEHLVQGRHADEDVALLEEGAAVSEEESEQQRADVRAIHVGICQ